MTPMATGFWMAVTPIVWAVCGYLSDKFTGRLDAQGCPLDASGALVSLVLFVPLWWALYFAIGMIREVAG